MKSVGEIIREIREEKKVSLRTVAAELDIDLAILSKIERGNRLATKEQILKISAYYNINKEDLLATWLSDKLIYVVEDEELALKAIQMAEEKLAYAAFNKVKRSDILKKIKNEIKKFPKIEKAWIYGSFSREEDGPKSDVDIALQTNKNFTYFDLAEVQHQLEKAIKRKVDVGFIDSFKPYILEHVKPDLKLIYEG